MRKGITVDHVSFWVDLSRFNVNIRGFSDLQCRRTMGLALEASFAPRILNEESDEFLRGPKSDLRFTEDVDEECESAFFWGRYEVEGG